MTQKGNNRKANVENRQGSAVRWKRCRVWYIWKNLLDRHSRVRRDTNQWKGGTQDDAKVLSLKCDSRNIGRATVYCHCETVHSLQKNEDTNKLRNKVKWIEWTNDGSPWPKQWQEHTSLKPKIHETFHLKDDLSWRVFGDCGQECFSYQGILSCVICLISPQWASNPIAADHVKYATVVPLGHLGHVMKTNLAVGKSSRRESMESPMFVISWQGTLTERLETESSSNTTQSYPTL